MVISQEQYAELITLLNSIDSTLKSILACFILWIALVLIKKCILDVLTSFLD